MSSPDAPPPPPPTDDAAAEPTGAASGLAGSTIDVVMAALGNDAFSQLTSIWDEVGFSESERAVQMDALVQEMRRICDEKVADEEAVRDTFVSSIDENRAKIANNAACLGETAPNLDVDDEGHDIGKLALTEQLVFFEQLGSSLEARVTHAGEALRSHKETLAQLAAELGWEVADADGSSSGSGGSSSSSSSSTLGAKWVDLEDTSDLTTANLEAFEAKVEELKAVHVARVAQCLKLVVASQELIKEMAMDKESADGLASDSSSSDSSDSSSSSSSSSGGGGGSRWSSGGGGVSSDAQRTFNVKVMGSLVTLEGEFAEAEAASPEGDDDEGEEGAGKAAKNSHLTVRLAASESSVGISEAALAKLTAHHDALVAESDARKQYLIEMGDNLCKHWDLLSIGEEEQAAFEASLAAPPGGISLATIRKGEAELKRLEELKAARMVELLGQKRAEVRRLWRETSASSEQMAEFAAMHVADEALYTDALLEEHEAMVGVLGKRLETMQPLIKLVKKYYEAVEARAQLGEFQKDKERLKGRGAAKQLKLEEQMGKKIKQMPKIIESLTKGVKEWETANGGATFCVPTGEEEEGAEAAGAAAAASGGKSILEVVEETEYLFKAKKDGAMADKKAAKDKERKSQAIYHAPGSSNGRSSLLNDDNAPPGGGGGGSGSGATRNGGKRGTSGKKSSISGSAGHPATTAATATALGEVSASRRNSDD